MAQPAPIVLARESNTARAVRPSMKTEDKPAYENRTAYLFTADGQEWAILSFDKFRIEFEETRKNGQENHMSGEASMVDGKWLIEDDTQISEYSRPETAREIEAYFDEHGTPAKWQPHDPNETLVMISEVGRAIALSEVNEQMESVGVLIVVGAWDAKEIMSTEVMSPEEYALRCEIARLERMTERPTRLDG